MDFPSTPRHSMQHEVTHKNATVSPQPSAQVDGRNSDTRVADGAPPLGVSTSAYPSPMPQQIQQSLVQVDARTSDTRAAVGATPFGVSTSASPSPMVDPGERFADTAQAFGATVVGVTSSSRPHKVSTSAKSVDAVGTSSSAQ